MTGLIVVIALFVVAAVGVTWGVNFLTVGDGTATRVTAITCVVVFSFFSWLTYKVTYSNDRWITCTVTSKDRGADDGSYRVYTSNCGQLANEDSWLRGKVNSADVWQQIPEKGTVRLHVAGVRSGFFSQFPNIFAVEPVATTQN